MKIVFNPLVAEFQLVPDRAREIYIADAGNFYESETVEGALQEIGLGRGRFSRVGGGGGLSDAPSDGNTYGRNNGAWAVVTAGGGGGGTWGSITGTLSNQTDLQTALDAKQDAFGFTPLNPANNLSDLASVVTARSNLGLEIGVNVQAYDANLTTWAAKVAPSGTVADQAYVDAAVVGLLDFKGSTDASTNPNYPAALKGDSYIVSVAGKIGGASGKSVDVGDVYFATADNAGGTEASVGTSWAVLEHSLAGALLAANNLSDLTNTVTARTNLGAQAALGYVPVDVASASWIDLTDGGATILHTHAATGVGGSGVVGQLAEWVTNTTTLQAAKLIAPTGAILTLVNANAKSITFPGSTNDIVAMLATANIFTTSQVIDMGADAVELRLQAHSTKLTNYLTVETSGAEGLFSIGSRGQLGIGPVTTTLTSNALFAFINSNFDFSGAMNVTSTVTQTGVIAFINGDVRITGSSTFQNFRGLNFNAGSRNSSTTNVVTGISGGAAIKLSTGRASTLTGGSFFASTDDATGGTVATLRALALQASVTHASVTATNAYGIDLADFINSGTVGTIYGAKIGNQAVGTYTDAFALQAGTGRVSLLGSITKASAAGAVWDGIEFRAATATITGSTNINTATGFNYYSIARPTLSAASALIVSLAATLYLANSPLGGGAGPVTITEPYTIWSDAGINRFDGGIQDRTLTAGRVTFAGTNGLLSDDADFTFAIDTLTATKIVGTTSVKVGTAAGYISSDGSNGATGIFETVDLKTVTVKDGIITSIV